MHRLILGALVPLWLAWPPAATPPPRVAVLSIALHDVSNQPVSPALPDRMHALTAALRERLASACGYEVVPVDSLSEARAERGQGYLYAHPDLAVALVAPTEAEWVVIPRLNRATPWVTDLHAHVVRTRGRKPHPAGV